MATLRRALRHFVTGLLALVLLFEEWGWEPLAALLARLGRLPIFARLERGIRALPPWAALATFAIPALALLPIKLLALYFIGKGHAMMGVIVLLLAKLTGTAVLAWLFMLTQPTLMRLRWFAHWYPRWKAWKDRLMEQLRQSPLWRTARRTRERVREQWTGFKRRHGLGDNP